MKLEKLPLQNHNYQKWRTRGLDEYIDEQHHKVIVNGFDFADHDPDELTVGADVRTSGEWAVRHNVPVQSGVIRKIRYRDGRTTALLIPFGPSLLPYDGVWLNIEDLVRS